MLSAKMAAILSRGRWVDLLWPSGAIWLCGWILVIMASGNGLLPLWHQTITGNNTDLFSIESSKNLSEIWMIIKFVIQQNAFETVYKIMAIFFRPWSVNSLRPSDAYMCRRTGSSLVLNQCLNIFNWTFRDKLQWNFNRKSNIFIHENAFEDVVCEMASILSLPQCVNYMALHELVDILWPPPHRGLWSKPTYCRQKKDTR